MYEGLRGEVGEGCMPFHFSEEICVYYMYVSVQLTELSRVSTNYQDCIVYYPK